MHAGGMHIGTIEAGKDVIHAANRAMARTKKLETFSRQMDTALGEMDCRT